MPDADDTDVAFELALTPEQPPEVVRAVAGLVGDAGGRPDPWWRAGVDENLYA
jgi:hypothetical protein